MSNLEQVKAYLELAERATPGPWTHNTLTPAGIDNTELKCWIPQDKNDASLIAVSRTMGPALAKALIRAEEALYKIAHNSNGAEIRANEALTDIEAILGTSK